MTFRVRALDKNNGDMVFGQGSLNFLIDSPEAVGQCIATRLKLWEGEWFLDVNDGTPWLQQILASKNVGLAQALIRERIMGTPFVTGITDFSVAFDTATRKFVLTGNVSTAFGRIGLADIEVLGFGGIGLT